MYNSSNFRFANAAYRQLCQCLSNTKSVSQSIWWQLVCVYTADKWLKPDNTQGGDFSFWGGFIWCCISPRGANV